MSVIFSYRKASISLSQTYEQDSVKVKHRLFCTSEMKFYAVRNGRQSGIFRTWEECREQVHQYKGAIFKSFNSEEEANEYLKNGKNTIVEFEKNNLKRPSSSSDKNGLENQIKRTRNIEVTDGFYILKFDGGSRGNPGYGGSGALLLTPEGKVCWDGYFFQGNCTNNQAEYKGLIEGLKSAREANIKKLRVMGDSNLVVEQMQGKWKVNNEELIKLHKEAFSLASEFEDIKYSHVYREHNSKADKLANYAMDTRKSCSTWKIKL